VQQIWHRTGVATEHPQRGRGGDAGEIEAGGPRPVLQVFEPDQHVHVGPPPAGGGQDVGVAVIGGVREDLGHGLGLSPPKRPRVVLGQRCGLGVQQGGEDLEHGGVVDPPLDPPARPVRMPRQEELVGLGGLPVVGLGTVLIQQIQQLCAPGAQLSGCVVAGVRGDLLLGAGPDFRREVLGGGSLHEPGDDLYVPQARRPRGERRRGGRQPGRQHLTLQIHPRDDLVGGHHHPARLELLAPQQIGQRRHRPLSPLGEDAAPLQLGHRVHHGPLGRPLHRRLHSQGSNQFLVADLYPPSDTQCCQHFICIVDGGDEHVPSIAEQTFERILVS